MAQEALDQTAGQLGYGGKSGNAFTGGPFAPVSNVVSFVPFNGFPANPAVGTAIWNTSNNTPYIYGADAAWHAVALNT